MNQNTLERLEVLNQQFNEILGLYRTAVSHIKISENEFWIWYTLIIMKGEYSQQDICSAWSLSKQTVNTIITHMVRKGYATLEVVPGTRNRKIICLTETGRSYGESIIFPISEAEQRAFEQLPTEDIIAFSTIFDKYMRLLKDEFNAIE